MTEEFTAKKILLQLADGSYAIPYTENPTWGSLIGDLADQEDLQASLNSKQGVLTAGDNITIENGVISASGSGARIFVRNWVD